MLSDKNLAPNDPSSGIAHLQDSPSGVFLKNKTVVAILPSAYGSCHADTPGIN